MANGVYWVGNDGNYWTKTSSGVNNLGYAGTTNPNLDVINGLSRIDNPSGTQNYQVGTDSAAPYSGGGGDTTSAPDPYAQWGGQGAYNNLVNQFNTQKSGVFGSANEAGDAYGSEYKRGIDNWLTNTRYGQEDLNNKGAKNELAKQQGVQGIVGMVGRGIKSAGVMLAGKNAGNSSAAQALASAYGDQGRRQMASVGNQYEMANQDLQTEQNRFTDTTNLGYNELIGKKNDFINNTVLDARNKLAQLDAWSRDKSLPQRIQAEQEKETVRNSLIQKLQGYDNELTQGKQGINPFSMDQRREKAQTMGQAGQSLGADAFNYTTEVPGQFQGTGDYASTLPLFTYRGKRQ